MTREEAMYLLNNLRSVAEGKEDEAIDMAIEALSKPNYETDTEVRLAVTNREKEKVILWDSFGEVEYYPIEALQTAEINCVHGKRITKYLNWVSVVFSHRNGLRKHSTVPMEKGERNESDNRRHKSGVNGTPCRDKTER